MGLDVTPQIQNVYNPDFSGIQKVAFDGSVQSTNAIKAEAILLFATQDCFIVVGTNPTAASTGMFIPKGMHIAIAIDPSHKIAAIKDSAAGNLYVTPLN